MANKNMKIVHVIPHVDKEAAGPSYSVPRLCGSLAALRNEVELSCLAGCPSIPGVSLDIHREWRFPRKFAISSSHAAALSWKANYVDIVHNHSLWSMVNVAAGYVVPGKKAKLVTSPRGTLSAWALNRSNIAKQVLWPLQRRVLERADLLHATSEAEYRDIRFHGFTAPVAIIPNGVDLPILTTKRGGVDFPSHRTLLFLSRIHPIKGLDRLLIAWASICDNFPDWRLVIAGTGSAEYVREVVESAPKLGAKRVKFVGPLYGDAKGSAYLDADLFILPTHSENFGMVVAESLAHGCPAIVSQGAPWSGLEVENCGVWVENDVESLVIALEKTMKLTPDVLRQMGLNGRDWMHREFGWDAIGQRMHEAYQWLLNGGERPPFVRVD
jgi:glycosyltransferase involved in cell wall biosynthesis